MKEYVQTDLSTYEDIISLGNNCNPALSLRELGLKKETYPFDWVRSNPKIIYDVLTNGPERYVEFGHPDANNYDVPDEFEIKHMYACFNNKMRNFSISHINYYGQHFMHYVDVTTDALKNTFDRYMKRFFVKLSNSRSIVFLHTTENYILHKLSRDNKDIYYDYLVKIAKHLEANYPALAFQIVNIEVDNHRKNTRHILNYSMDYSLPFSDQCEAHADEFLIPFRKEVTGILKEILQPQNCNGTTGKRISEGVQMEEINIMNIANRKKPIRAAFYYSLPFQLRVIEPLAGEFKETLISNDINEVKEWKPNLLFIADGGAIPHLRKICDINGTILIGLRHGVANKYIPTEQEYSLADYVCGSNWDRRDFFASGVFPKKDFLITGNPWVDGIFSVPKRELNKENPTILFAPTYNPEVSAAVFLKGDLVPLIREIYPHSTIIIKPHPAIIDHNAMTHLIMDKELYQELIDGWDYNAKTDKNVRFIKDSKAAISDYFSEADILISDGSSLIFEFMALNRPILLYTNDNKVEMWSSIYDSNALANSKRNVGVEFRNKDEFLQALRDAFSLHEEIHSKFQQEYTQEILGEFTDGLSYKRVAESVKNILNDLEPDQKHENTCLHATKRTLSISVEEANFNDELIEKAATAVDRGQLAEANQLLLEAILHNPDSPRTLHQFAILKHQQGETGQAAAILEKAKALAPTDAEIANDLGAMYYHLGAYDKAISQFSMATELDTTLLDAKKNLADLHAASGRITVAEALYKEILALNPNDPEIIAALKGMAGDNSFSTNRKSCPVCGNIAYRSVTKLDHTYYSCTNCGSVFTSSIDPKVLITDNQGSEGRHTPEIDNVRLSYLMHEAPFKIEKVLDFGCGRGEYGKLLASRGVQCLEIDQDTKLQLKDIPSESIDGINMVEVIEHLYDPASYFREFFRVLKPGGRMFVESSFVNGQDLETWEYLSPAIGHCLIHSERSLILLAQQFRFSMHRINPNCYLFEKPVEAQKPDNLTTHSFLPNDKQKGAASEPPKRDVSERSPKCMDTVPLASIIIPVFNQVEFTSRCLETLYQNTPLDRICEVIIVDNASSDGTQEFLDGARKRYPKLEILTNKENLLFAKACNRGADIAKGDYLVFLNNDTEPLPGWFDRALERLESDESIGIVGIKLLYPDGTVQHCGIQFYRDANPAYVVWPLHRYLRASVDDPRVNIPQDVHAVTAACLFIPRELFRRIGGFEERYGMYFEDTDLCFKARRAGKRVFYEPGSVVIHYEGKSSPNQKIIDELNTRAARLFYKLWKEDLYLFELETLIEREDGKYAYFPDNFWPQGNMEEVVQMHHLLSGFPSCYVHFGGSGDALLLLSTFYDRNPEQTIVSISNSTSMMKSFFDAFPKLKKVYFIPFPKNYAWHFTARKFFKSFDTCLGLGATPTTEADYKEWSANLNIFRAYGIQRRPLWAVNFTKCRLESRQVTIQPRGSLKGMVGSKRNALSTQDWAHLLSYLGKKGVRPIIIGTPDEATEYPCLGNAIDKRSYSFAEQMQLIAGSDFFIGADSWGKTFSALAGIPTFVFYALRGDDLKNWIDDSDHVFLDPWEEITVVKDLKTFRNSFDAAWRDIFPSAADLKIRWEGSQFVHHSLALVNRELCLCLIAKGCEVTIVPYETDQFTPKKEPRLKPIAERTKRPLSGPADVHVRHQWPPNFNPPSEGHWVIIQPWEFGSIPREWVRHMAVSVDEVWVPSHYVRDCYIQSGVPSERVFVVPNGVNIDLFNPDNIPYQLKTKKRFKFLFVGGTIYRKGIDILLDVYTKTFSSRDDVCLVIKDMGGQAFYKGLTAKEVIDRIQAEPGSPEIEYIEHTLDSHEIASLYCACDCLVHPYRGEGFGLPIAEAMASGLPVIVTGLGAALDFCHDRIAYLIPAQKMLFPEKRIDEYDTVDFPWLAEPDKEGLARLMKHVAAHREEAAAKGIQAASFIRANFTWDHAAEAVMTRVRQLQSKPIVRHSPAVESTWQVRNNHGERISIVILTLNELEYTKKCVESLRRHTPETHEIIFVDNGSEDETVKWLRSLVEENAGYKLIENGKNLGFTKGCNQGIEAASGDYILLLNNDVVVTAGWLSGMIDQMKAYPNSGMVGPMTNYTSGPQLVDGVPYGDDLSGLHAFAVDFRREHARNAAYEWRLAEFCLLIRREVLDIIGGFDESYGYSGYENDDLCLRSLLAGYRHIIARDVFVHHYGHRTLLGNAIDCSATCESDLEYFGRKWSRFVTPWTKSATDKGYTVTQNITGQECIEELLHWGEQCFVQGVIKRAVKIFERVLCLDPQNAQALNNLGVIQWQLGDMISAMNIFQRALAINPKDPDALENLMQAATETGRFDLIKQDQLTTLNQAQPGNPDLMKLINTQQDSASTT